MFKSFFSGWFPFITGFVLLTSCSSDPEPRNRFDFAAGSSYTSGNRTNVTAGEILSTSLYAETASSDATFTRLKITCNYDTTVSIEGKPTVTFLDSVLNKSNLAMVFTTGTRGRQAGLEYWTFTLEDSQGKTYTKNYRIVTTKTDAVYQAYSSVFYHKTALENIKYFSTNNGLAFPGYIGRQKSIQDSTDFYFQIDNPDNNAFSLRSSESPDQKTKTTFRTTNLTTDEFNSIATVAAITEAYTNNTATEVFRIDKSKADSAQVIAFKTGNAKIGVMRMDTMQVLPATNGGTKTYRMLYSIKMQKP
ncbi:MAG: hypothetical protein COW65_02590 [Cytophagales bacterium CG18_big_fil_WC_8_21_14_2_50_42_9]|nr:MAG: hypothetical protein COW65_02590 [Cytophagales bacterium CG18_big_fil_WC_8_21_14_2_50_42_9]